jgi:predicted DNA binding CopG/RHH family protein
MPLRQTQLRVPEDELEQARKVAAAKGISLSEYLRRALAVQLAYERAVEVQAA